MINQRSWHCMRTCMQSIWINNPFNPFSPFILPFLPAFSYLRSFRSLVESYFLLFLSASLLCALLSSSFFLLVVIFPASNFNIHSSRKFWLQLQLQPICFAIQVNLPFFVSTSSIFPIFFFLLVFSFPSRPFLFSSIVHRSLPACAHIPDYQIPQTIASPPSSCSDINNYLQA